MGPEQGNSGKASISRVESDAEPFSDDVIARAKRAGKVLEKQLAKLDKTSRNRERDIEELWNKEVTI